MTKYILKRKKGLTRQDIALEGVFTALLIIVFILSVYPVYYITVASFNDPKDLALGGVYFWPRVFSLESYITIFEEFNFFNPLFISFARTVVGLVASVLCCSMLAFVLCQRHLIGRKFWVPYFVFTMYFSAGTIPIFLLNSALGLGGTFAVYIIPSLVRIFEVILVRVYIDSLPDSIQESAKIDGANEFIIYARIILPLCLPILATIAIFVGVYQWNQWYDTFLYNMNRMDLWPLQMHLVDILQSSGAIRISSSLDLEKLKQQSITPTSIRLAITVITTLPIVVIYPFFQKYFVKGVMLGAVKE